MQKLFTTREVADMLRMRVETITRKAEQGLLPAIKVDGRWRIPQDRLNAWLEEREEASPLTRKAKVEKPVRLKTYHLGEVYGTISRREIYEGLDG
jgi:excisionase family DNA binding protein